MSPTSPLLHARGDERIVDGRAKRSGETYYTIPGMAMVNTVNISANINRDVYAAWFTLAPIVVDQMAFEVTTLAAGNTRIGFYRADRDWQPIGAPLADSGDISTNTTGVKTYTPSTPIIVRPGRYLSVINSGTAGPSVRTFRGGHTAIDELFTTTPMLSEMRVTRTYAAFPTPGSPWDADAVASNPPSHRVVYRVSQP